MRIGLSSTQNNGKTTLLKAMQQLWPMFKSPEKTYRDLIKEKNLSLNESGTQESQEIMREALRQCALDNKNEKYIIHDRTILDNLAYSVYLSERGKLEDDFLADSINMTRDTLKMFDIIFWLPLNPNIKIVEQENRSTNEEYRQDIDFIFETMINTYKNSAGLIFPVEDCPAVIELTGDLNEKLQIIKEYIDEKGNLVETEKSVFAELEEVYEQARLVKQVKSGKN